MGCTKGCFKDLDFIQEQVVLAEAFGWRQKQVLARDREVDAKRLGTLFGREVPRGFLKLGEFPIGHAPICSR
jgi:hypothetical protein